MIPMRLTITSKYDGATVAIYERDADGTPTVEFATDQIRPDCEQLVQHGLSELLQGEDHLLRRRKTQPNDPLFLERVAELCRNYGFHAEMEETT